MTLRYHNSILFHRYLTVLGTLGFQQLLVIGTNSS